MVFDITLGNYKLRMLDKVEIHKSQELLADTATITLPSSQFNVALDVESKISRGDAVSIKFGYKETGMVDEFEGWIQRIATDGGNITIECEDDLHLMRKAVTNKTFKKVSLKAILEYIVSQCGVALDIDCTYSWSYSKFVINNATGYEVLKKVQEDCGADIFILDNKLCVHAPGESNKDLNKKVYYDFARNVEKESLNYHDSADKKFEIVVKANQPDGTVKEIKVGSTGGDKIEIKCATSDDASMKARANAELKRRCFSGYDGNITTWLIPHCIPGDSAVLHDSDYPEKDGTYFVNSVTTSFSSAGGSRKVDISFRLS